MPASDVLPVPSTLRRLRNQTDRRAWRAIAEELKGKGVSLKPRALERYEDGSRNPDLDVLVVLLDHFGATDADWLSLRDAVREQVRARLQESTSADVVQQPPTTLQVRGNIRECAA